MVVDRTTQMSTGELIFHMQNFDSMLLKSQTYASIDWCLKWEIEKYEGKLEIEKSFFIFYRLRLTVYKDHILVFLVVPYFSIFSP